MLVEILRYIEKCIANLASEAFEEVVDVIDVNNVVVLS